MMKLLVILLACLYTSTNAAVANLGIECYGGGHCDGITGLCPSFCGDGAWCRQNWDELCFANADRGCSWYHCCVTPDSSNSQLYLVFDSVSGSVTDLSAGITGQSGSSAGNDDDDPWPIKDRGYYFSNSIFHLPPYKGLEDDPIFLNPDFTIEMWVKSDFVSNVRCILGKWTEGYSDQIEVWFEGDDELKFAVQGVHGKAEKIWFGTAGLHLWQFYGLTCDYQTDTDDIVLGLHVNQNTFDFVNFQDTGIFEDLATNLFALGADYNIEGENESFFQGFIYSVELYFYIRTNEQFKAQNLQNSACSGSCNYWPATGAKAGVCLSDCSQNQYIDSSGGACQECSSNCQNGCVRSTDCNLCASEGGNWLEYSNSCTSFTEVACKSCRYNMVNNEGTCECDASQTQWTEVSACHDDCPTGFTSVLSTTSSSQNICERQGATLILHYKFDKITGTLDDEVSGLTGLMGIGSDYYPNYEQSDPWAMYLRGIYFTGESRFNLPPYNGLTGNPVILNPSFSVEVWARITDDSEEDNLLVGKWTEDGSNRFLFYVTPSSSQVVVNITTQSSTTSIQNEWETSYAADKNWHFFACYVSYKPDRYSSHLGLHIDKDSFSEYSGNENDGYWLDQLIYPFGLGFDMDGDDVDDYLNGFMYEIKFYNIARSLQDFSTMSSNACFLNDCDTCCSICPTDNQCLSICDFDQYISIHGCHQCDSSCSTGCVRAENCNLCNTDFCDTCEEFDTCPSCTTGDCTKCGDNNNCIECTNSDQDPNQNCLWYGLLTNEQHDEYISCEANLENGLPLPQSCIDELAPLCCDSNGAWIQACIDNGVQTDFPMLCCTCQMDLYYNDQCDDECDNVQCNYDDCKCIDKCLQCTADFNGCNSCDNSATEIQDYPAQTPYCLHHLVFLNSVDAWYYEQLNKWDAWTPECMLLLRQPCCTGKYAQECQNLFNANVIDCTLCSPQCTDDLLFQNTVCDTQCDLQECGWDDHHCPNDNCNSYCQTAWIGNESCDPWCNYKDWAYDGGDCTGCSQFCKYNEGTYADTTTCETADGGQCNTPECNWWFGFGYCDGADDKPACSPDLQNNNICDYACYNETGCERFCSAQSCNYDNQNWATSGCNATCDSTLLQNETCDPGCNYRQCAYDEGDCTGCSQECKDKEGLYQSSTISCEAENECNTAACNWCFGWGYCDQAQECTPDMQANDVCDEACNIASCNYDNTTWAQTCHSGCDNALLGNNVCDFQCNYQACAYDEGDCTGCSDYCKNREGQYDGQDYWESDCNTEACNWWYGWGYCDQDAECSPNLLLDAVCDTTCNNAVCNYDNCKWFNARCTECSSLGCSACEGLFQLLNYGCTDLFTDQEEFDALCVDSETPDASWLQKIRDKWCPCMVDEDSLTKEGCINLYQDLCDERFAGVWDDLHVQVTSGYFLEDYVSMRFEFEDVLQSYPNSCSIIFHADTIPLFGSNPTCTWGSPILTVGLGEGATVTTDTPINFQTNGLSMTSDYYQYSNEAVTSIAVSYPYAFPKPTAVIAGPSTAFECNNFYVASGQDSLGRLRRTLTYEWSLNGGFVSSNEVLAVEKALYEGSTSFTIGLVVTNYLGERSDPVSLSVQVDSTSIITVTFEHGDVQSVKRSNPNKFPMYISKGDCATTLELSSLAYTWMQIDGDEIGFSDIVSKLVNSRTLEFDSNVLSVGVQYIFQVKVNPSIADPTPAQITLEVTASDLVANIGGGNRQVNINDAFEMSAQNSYDPDNLSGDLSFSWTCQLKSSSASCTGYSGAIATVPAGSLSNSTTYVYTMTVTKDSRSASMTTEISTTSAAIPTVSIVQDFDLVNKSEKVVLSTVVQSTGARTVSWTQNEPLRPVAYITPLDQVSITIRENSLSELHGDYTFSVTVTDSQGSASSFITFAVNKEPLDGTFEIAPNTGIELTTEFTLRAKNWNDPEQNFPLTYQYFQNSGGSLSGISGQILENNFLTILAKSPTGGTTLYVRVYDSLNSYAQATAAVTVTAGNVDVVKASQDLAQDISTLRSQEVILSTTGALADSAFTNDTYTSQEKEYVYDNLLTSINEWNGLSDKLSDADVNSAFDTINSLTQNPDQLTTKQQIDTLKLEHDLLGKMQKLSESSAKSSILNLDHLISANAATTAGDSTDNSQLIDIENTIRQVAELSLTESIPNEDAIISQQKNIACSFQRLDLNHLTSDNHTVPSSGTSSKNAIVKFPNDLLSETAISSDDAIDLILQSKGYEKGPEHNNDSQSHVVVPVITIEDGDFQIQNTNYAHNYTHRSFTGADTIDVTPEVVGTIGDIGRVQQNAQPTEITVANLTDPVSIYIPLYDPTTESGKDMVCMHRQNIDEDWAYDGCSFQGTEDGLAICKCDHLTIFSLDSAPDAAEDAWLDSNIAAGTDFTLFAEIGVHNLHGLVLVSFFYAIFIGILIIFHYQDKVDYARQEEVFNTYEQILPYIMHDVLYDQEIRQHIEDAIATNNKKTLKKEIKNAFRTVTGEEYAKLSHPVKKMFLKMMGQMDFITLYKETPIVHPEPQIQEIHDRVVVDPSAIERMFIESESDSIEPMTFTDPDKIDDLSDINIEIQKPTDRGEKDPSIEQAKRRQQSKGLNKVFIYLNRFQMKDQYITDIKPSERVIDHFILKNELLSLVLSIQVNFSRVARLTVFFSGIVGSFWVCGVFFDLEQYEEDNEMSIWESFTNFGWKEFFIIVYSFLLTEPVKILIELLLENDNIYIELTQDEKKRAIRNLKVFIGYTIAVIWLIWCYIGIVLVSIVLEDRYNGSQAWVTSYLIGMMVNVLILIHVKALVWAMLYQAQRRWKGNKNKHTSTLSTTNMLDK